MSTALVVRYHFPDSLIIVTVRDVQNVMPSGPALRRERDALGLAAGDIARQFGVTEARIRGLELQGHVRDDTARRYIAAIEAAQRERERRATSEAIERVERVAAGLSA